MSNAARTHDGEDFLDVVDDGDQSLHSEIACVAVHGCKMSWI